MYPAVLYIASVLALCVPATALSHPPKSPQRMNAAPPPVDMHEQNARICVRLQEHIRTLESYYNEKHFRHFLVEKAPWDEVSHIVDNPQVQAIVNLIAHERKMTPLEALIDLAQEALMCESPQPVQFGILRDAAGVIFMTYNLFIEYGHHKQEKMHGANARYRPSLYSLALFYTELSQLPLEQLFDVLEECRKQFETMIVTLNALDHETTLSGHTWWAAPVAVLFAVVSFVRWMRERPRMAGALQ
jgi:hypothetical protein